MDGSIIPDGAEKNNRLSMLSLTSSGSRNRREGPLLTLIPEGERTIDHRLQFIIVGKGARVLSERIVNSDFNDSFRPRATPHPRHSEPRSTSSSTTLTRPEPVPGTKERRRSVDSVASVAKANTEDEHLVFFCPTDAVGSSLARVRMHVVEGFSASMPPVNDESSARDACVALLHWRDGEETRRPESPQSSPSWAPRVEGVEETVQEFTMRAAEMNHGMRFMPLVFLLGINEAQEGMLQLEEAVSKRVFKDGSKTRLLPVEDNSDEGILDAIQDLVRLVIKERSRALNSKASRSFTEPPTRSICCTIV